ncbi:SUN domain-containing protein [Plasmodium yoelii yoelii]|nr:SUN domain-containing protein [Plasmodium yoelii yoelii]
MTIHTGNNRRHAKDEKNESKSKPKGRKGNSDNEANYNIDPHENEDNSLIQVLHSYEDFQNNKNYTKLKPCKTKETKFGRVRKTLIKIFSLSDLEVNEPNKNNFNRKKNGPNNVLLTSRMVMWNKIENNNDPMYDLKIESSHNKSFVNIIANYISMLLNDILNDRKGIAYIAIFMIVLSILITCISGFITIFNNAKIDLDTWGIIPSKSSYDGVNKFMGYLKLGEEESNKKIINQNKNTRQNSKAWKFQELFDDVKNKINESINLNFINKKESGNVSETYSNIKNKQKELENNFKRIETHLKKMESKLKTLQNDIISKTSDIDYFKNDSKKEVENIKKKLQDNYQLFQNKFVDYLKIIDDIKIDVSEKKKTIFNEIENKVHANQISIEEGISSKIEHQKNYFFEKFSKLEKQMEDIEISIANKTYSNFENNEFLKNGGDEKKNVYIYADKQIEDIKKITDEENKKLLTEYKKKQIETEEENINRNNYISKKLAIIEDIRKELDILKERTEASKTFLDKIFPNLELKMLKNVENKMKYYLEIYKKDIINELTETTVISNEKKYKNMALKQEKSQKEFFKKINIQINSQIKNIKEELNKSIDNALHSKEFKNDKDLIKKINQTNYNAIETLQEKVDELYNEFILDYNQIDWALESLGAKIVYKMTSYPLNKNDFIEKFLNQIVSFLPSEEIYGMVKPMGKDPSIILKPSNFPGDCFSFKGNTGKVTIHLPATINVTSVSIQHVHENISNNVNATPKYFSVYGVVDPNWPEHFEESNIDYNDFKNSSLYSCLHKEYGILYPNEILEKWIKHNKNPSVIHIGDFYFDRKKRISTYQTKHCFPFKR